WTSWILVGFPFIAVFTNSKRRPLYDRINDTDVISVSGRFADEPEKRLMQVWRALIFAFILVGGASVFREMLIIGQHGDDLMLWREELKNSSYQSCPLVKEAQEEWGAAGTENLSRLRTAMTLYSANAVEGECLAVE